MVEKKKEAVQKTKATKARKVTSPRKATPKPAKKVAKKPTTKAPKKPGRPTDYSEEIAVKILVEVALGKSMRKIAEMEGMPAMSTIFLWLRNHEDFSEQYARAKEEAADLLVDEMLDIADDATNDWMEKYGKDGEMIGYMINGEFVGRSKLRIETRKWLAMKLKPKRYGDKLNVEQGGEVTVKHSYAGKSDEELDAIVRNYVEGKK